MNIAVTLLVVLLVVSGAGTIVESAKGSEAAGLLVYLAINVLASIVDHWPWGARRTGFAFTHGALVIILAGAAVTQPERPDG